MGNNTGEAGSGAHRAGGQEHRPHLDAVMPLGHRCRSAQHAVQVASRRVHRSQQIVADLFDLVSRILPRRLHLALEAVQQQPQLLLGLLRPPVH